MYPSTRRHFGEEGSFYEYLRNIDFETLLRIKLSLRVLFCLKLHIVYKIPSGYIQSSTAKQWNVCGTADRRGMQLD
jgi:hypothetical protein